MTRKEHYACKVANIMVKNISVISDCVHIYHDNAWCPEVFCKKGVLKIFLKLTGKHLCQSLFFNKVAGLRPETLLKKELLQRCFL